jgi:chorismate synthase
MSNTFGRSFRCTTWGESHGAGIGVVVDGCPPRLPITRDEIQIELDRRRPGQSDLTTPRNEADQVEILSGLLDGLTTGAPIAMLVRNQDQKPEAYDHLKGLYRPSHADFTYEAKYGLRDVRGGGRSSARETIGRVAAGAIARKLLVQELGVEILAWVSKVHTLRAEVDPETVTRAMVESNPVRCPDPAAVIRMTERIQQAKAEGDSVGGLVEVIARGLPPGLGEPVFGKLDAELAAALMSLPAVKGVEVGSGFAGTDLYGSEHNDAFEQREGRTRTITNRSGGIQGGISNGEILQLRVAFKPTSTISKQQDTVDREGRSVKLEAQGRHDPCVLPRAVPIVEAMVALVLADQLLRHRGQVREDRF